MKKGLFIICMVLLCSCATAGVTKAKRLKIKYNNDPEFHAIVDLVFDLANKTDKQDLLDAFYLLKEVDTAMEILANEQTD